MFQRSHVKRHGILGFINFISIFQNDVTKCRGWSRHVEPRIRMLGRTLKIHRLKRRRGGGGGGGGEDDEKV